MADQTVDMLTPGTVSSLGAQDALSIVGALGDDFITSLRSVHAPPVGQKAVRLYRIREAAKLIGRSESWLRTQESEENFPELDHKAHGRQRLYSLQNINAIRAYAGNEPKKPSPSPYILGMVNFKGGSSKTTFAYLASHFLATSGYRVLLVDLDPQGSLTGSFELYSKAGERIPALDWDQTVGPLLAGETEDATSLILRTHWPTIDILPSAVDVYEAEMLLAVETMRQSAQAFPFWRRLDGVLRKIQGYDFIVLDSAPALNLAAINAVVAADGLVIPVPPRNLDLEAAVKFAKVVTAWTQQLPGFNDRKRWLRLFLTQVQKGSTSDQTHAMLARRYFGALIANSTVPMSEAIRRGSAGAPSCYEGIVQGDRNQADANRRIRESLDEVFQELLGIVLGTIG